MIKELTDWSVTDDQNPFRAPELCDKRLQGKFDGKNIITSYIQNVNGRVITTMSGSVYKLVGDPNKGYLAWMEQHGFNYDPENPIKMRL